MFSSTWTVSSSIWVSIYEQDYFKGVYVNYYNKFYSLLKRKIWHCHLWRGFKYAKNKVTNYIIKTYSRWAYISRETNFAMDVSEKIMFTGMINPLLLSPQCTYIIQFKRIKMSIRSWIWCVLAKFNQTNICSLWLCNIAFWNRVVHVQTNATTKLVKSTQKVLV